MRIDRLIILAMVLGLLQACVTVDAGPTKDEKASNINTELGLGYLQQNNLELANEKLLKALKQNPKNVKANYVYAVLQDRLKQDEVAEYHYKKATNLDPKNSEAANNFGAFLCRKDREKESEKYFLRALDNPLYKTPEYAYTNAAVCLLRIEQVEDAKEYLGKALAAKSDFGPALLAMGELLFNESEFAQAKPYLDRYHLVSRPSAKSLWLEIRTSLYLDSQVDVSELGQQLEEDFSDSPEYQSWLEIQ